MEDSGKRTTFQTGAVRDSADDKSRPDLISPFAQIRKGHWLAEGAKKYDERNWEKGMSFSRCIASIMRHLMQYMMGERNEDHLAAIAVNAEFLMHYEEMIEREVLPADLDDMPNYCISPDVPPDGVKVAGDSDYPDDNDNDDEETLAPIGPHLAETPTPYGAGDPAKASDLYAKARAQSATDQNSDHANIATRASAILLMKVNLRDWRNLCSYDQQLFESVGKSDCVIWCGPGNWIQADNRPWCPTGTYRIKKDYTEG